MAQEEPFDLIVVGSGPAASFFLAEALKHYPRNARIAVFERGSHNSIAWQIEHRKSSPLAVDETIVRHGNMAKDWRFSIGFGGGTNCWWGGTHRFHPNDFHLNTLYGQGTDWPFGYDELEQYYGEAEAIMQVAGEDGLSEIPRSSSFPQPPHSMIDPDRLLKRHHAGLFVANPAARARIATANRPACCASSVCSICPVDAKFTVLNGMKTVFDDPRVSLFLGSEVVAVETAGGMATGVRVGHGESERSVSGDAVAIAANAIFNPAILLRSGFDHPMLGKGLNEQLNIGAAVDLVGMDGFQGSSSFSGFGLMLHDGEHRQTAGACLIETGNVPSFRTEPGRWRQRVIIKLSVEDLPLVENRVELQEVDARPAVHFADYSAYAHAGLARAKSELARVLKVWPVEDIRFGEPNPADGHIMGTVRMGTDPRTSVVDGGQRVHNASNLLVLGSSVFPAGSSMNPTLTICALSLRAARKLLTSAI